MHFGKLSLATTRGTYSQDARGETRRPPRKVTQGQMVRTLNLGGSHGAEEEDTGSVRYLGSRITGCGDVTSIGGEEGRGRRG